MIAFDTLAAAWRNERARRLARYRRLPALADHGLELGAMTVLARRTRDRWGATDLALGGREARILALLAVAYWRPVSPSVIGDLRRAAKATARGDTALAAIHLAHSGLPKIDADEGTAFRLFAAERLLDAGVGPRALMRGLGLDTWPLDAIKAGFDPGASRDERGRWTNGGNLLTMSDTQSAPSPAADPATTHRATAIYGETAGLRPRLLDPAKSPNDPANWELSSAAQLAQARAYVGIVSDRNNAVHRVGPPDGSNHLESRAWSQAVEAARQGSDDSQLDPRITQFVLREGNDGPKTPRGWTSHVMLSLGPFYNVGGGDIAAGPQTFIDFYGK